MTRMLVIFLLSSSTLFAQTFTVKSKYEYMKKTAALAKCVLLHTEYQAEIMAIEYFDYTNDDGVDVMNKMLGDYEAIFYTYKSRNPFSSVLAYVNNGSNKVYFNRRNNPRAYKYMVNTAIHEVSHIRGYSHGDNSSAGKGASVPYRIGKISEKYVRDCELILGF